MKTPLVLLFVPVCGPCLPLSAEPAPVTLTLGATDNARPISPLFNGVSMETEAVLPAADGSHYFSPANTKLASLFRQMGVRHLRIGGNTVDDKTKTPASADIDELFGFAKAAGIKVTYSVRLKGGDPAESAGIAKHIYDHYADLATGITVGNESNNYLPMPAFLAAVREHIDAMKEAAPNVAVNGPGIHINPSWLTRYATTFKEVAKIDYIGAHAYFGGNAYGGAKPPVDRDPVPLRASMLSSSWHAKYAKFHRGFGPTLAKLGLPYRLDETNTYYMGGAPGASNSMAASIWALDYLYWWAEHGAQGINFHTGTTLPYKKGLIPNGATRKPAFYAVFRDLPRGGGYATQAVGYGMKTFDLGGHGKLFPVTVASEDKARVEAHAVLADDGGVFVTIINKEIAAEPRKVVLAQPQEGRFLRAESIALDVKDHDAGATEGFTIGGAGIGPDGSWNGKWSPAPVEGDGIGIVVPPTSAVIVHLTK